MSGFTRRWCRSLSRACRNTFLGSRCTKRPSVAGQIRRFLSGRSRSLDHGPTEPSLLSYTIPEHFARVVSSFGDKPAVISRCPSPDTIAQAADTVYTYEQLHLVSNHLAHSLRHLGVRKGDRVAINLGNGPEYAALTYAIFKLGAILVPLNPAFQSQQVISALSHLGVKVLIIASVADLSYKPCRGRDNSPLIRALAPNLASGEIKSPEIPSLQKIVVVDNACFHPAVPSVLGNNPALIPYDTLLEGFSHHASSTSSRTVVPESPLSADETINVQFTSGTTSQPKAAMLSHTSVLNNGYLIAHRMGLDPTDLIVCPPPLFHCFGCVLGYMATATTGAAILFPSPAFDPLASVRMAADYRATGLYGVPTMFVAMLEAVAAQAQQHPAVIPDAQLRALPQHLRKGIAAGSSIPAPLMQRLYDVLGLRDLVICYGMTETSPVSCMTSPADPPAKRMASVGRAMPHTAIKIVDPADRARIVPRGARGELAVAGYLVMKGYWGDEARTREVKVKEQWAEEDDSVSGGPRPKAVMWMYSGDEARMDAEGYVEITGRIKDLIIRGGENIHPLEIETCLFQHPLIAEASVVGVPDPRLGEAVVAFVNVLKGVSVVDGEYEQSVPTPEASAAAATTTTTTTAAAAVMVGVVEEDADKASGAKCLSKREVRDWVARRLSANLVPKYVFWVDEYPKTPSGKIQKYMLRDAAKGLLAGLST